MTPVYSLKSMLALGCAAALLPLLLFAQADDTPEPGFFITSKGPGIGGGWPAPMRTASGSRQRPAPGTGPGAPT